MAGLGTAELPVGWVSALEMVVWMLQTELCPFGFRSSASWTVGVPNLVATEILEVQHVFHSFKSDSFSSVTWLFSSI